MEKVHIVNHPLITHKLSILRDKNTGAKEFREVTRELTTMMTFEATRDLQIKDVQVTTPLCETSGSELAGKKLALIAVLRAGVTMADGITALIPAAKEGHIGIYRDPETMSPVEYYCKLPQDISQRDVIILDPMIATGGSASAAVQFVKNHGAESIKFVTLVASPKGLETLCRDHSDIQVFCAAVDSKLDEYGFISPGLGDFGDRVYGTK